jgi:hypothetical protein
MKKKAAAAELGGQPHEASQNLTFPLSKASPGVYSTYRNAILSLTLFICACVDCALRVGFLEVGDMLHGSTLPYIILVVDALLFTTKCDMHS